MKKKRALIIGISSQDGSYLAEFLLKKKYKIIGISRQLNESRFWRLERLKIRNKVYIEKINLNSILEIKKILKKYEFNEIYNFSSLSSVSKSFKNPLKTYTQNGLNVGKILEGIKKISPKSKFYQASSSEMFSEYNSQITNKRTYFNPQSPYAISKLFAHYITKNYRNFFNLYAVSGILHNHDSPLRGKEFITRKIILGLIKIINKDLKFVEVGNLYAKRDWGYAKDYVKIMWKMLQNKIPQDYVISTGKVYSIKHFINLTTKYLNLKTKWVGTGLNERLINKKNNQIIIKINPKYLRSFDYNVIKKNSKKANKNLKWKIKTDLKKLIKIMVDEEIKHYSQSKKL